MLRLPSFLALVSTLASLFVLDAPAQTSLQLTQLQLRYRVAKRAARTRLSEHAGRREHRDRADHGRHPKHQILAQHDHRFILLRRKHPEPDRRREDQCEILTR